MTTTTEAQPRAQRAGVFATIARFIKTAAERRAIAAVERELARLTDRQLRDIGLTRTEISHAVRYGRTGT